MAEKGVDIKALQRRAVNGFAFCRWLKQKSPLFAIPYMAFSDIAESKHWHLTEKHNIVEHMFYFPLLFSLFLNIVVLSRQLEFFLSVLHTDWPFSGSD